MESKNIKWLLVAIALLIAPIASAYDFEVDGIYYNKLSDESVEVTHGDNKYLGAVNIPSQVTYECRTYIVTTIGSEAFLFCSGLTSVSIPNTVTSFCLSAFQDCSGLTSVTIPSSVKHIGHAAFSSCSGLQSLAIPNSVIEICPDAFSYCSGLTSVTISNSVTEIAHSAFSGCTGLTSVTIPNSVTSIGFSAFSGCSGLTSVTIPNSVNSIDDYAFSDCGSLTSVIIPSSVNEIGECAFLGCVEMDEMIVESGNTIYDSRDMCNAVIETKTNSLISACKSTIIPNSVTSIGYGAFAYCNGLTSIIIPLSVTEIGGRAFFNCTELTALTIPNSVTSIGESAFQYTPFYNNQPDGVVYFGRVLYNYKGKMLENTSIAIKDGTASISPNAFEYCSGLTSVTIPNSVTEIGSRAFYSCSGLTSLTIPNSVTTIGTAAFSGCTGLTSVTIPNSVTEIGYYAFQSCKGLTNVTIPGSVNSIGPSAFSHCSGLKKSAYPNHLSNPFSNGIAIAYPSNGKIESNGAIYNNDYTSLYFVPYEVEEFVIPGTVSEIGENAFACCSDLINLTSYALVPPTCGNNALEDINKTNCTLFVPEASIGQYKAADQWKDFYSFGVSGIDDVSVDADSMDAPVEYYNLQGIRIENPTTGVYIRRQGSSTTKVTIK